MSHNNTIFYQLFEFIPRHRFEKKFLSLDIGKNSFLEEQNIKVSMDSKVRAWGYAYIGRVWRGLKYENIKLNDYKDLTVLRQGINKYFMSTISVQKKSAAHLL